MNLKKKNVIVDEIIRAQDNTEGYVNEKIYSVLYKGSGHDPAGGIPETVQNYDYDESYKYYKYFYRPENIVVSICSNKEFSEIKDIVANCDLAEAIPESITPTGLYRPVLTEDIVTTRKTGRTYLEN